MHPRSDDSSFAIDTFPDAPPEGERWSSWDGATHGPKPRPDWVITELGAVEQDLGVLKTGKEADVHVIRRWLPDGTDSPARDCLMAAKRFRPAERRLFHRDAGYLEGRRVRRSREMRAMAKRTEFGREIIAGQWAYAEFEALIALTDLGLPVPYPVQHDGTEMLMEFIGTDGVAAPRLAAARVERAGLPDLFEQARDTLVTLAGEGWAHGVAPSPAATAALKRHRRTGSAASSARAPWCWRAHWPSAAPPPPRKPSPPASPRRPVRWR